MRRTVWEFRYTGAELAEAALKRRDYHTKRHEAWQQELDAAEKALKEKGFVVRENNVTGGTRADVVLDQELLKRYNECWNKRAEHKQKTDEFDNWAFVLGRNKDVSLELNWDDVLYFRVGDE